jgi:hypothetical protein
MDQGDAILWMAVILIGLMLTVSIAMIAFWKVVARGRRRRPRRRHPP